ncbi:MAG: DEAD/DEAH box helicase [Verrucomicrobia bacterium]|nr:DEAD/DEAH box helicase [Verrucomicrobiota bacterium]MBI3869654.1 DEAD/DEAH box helicase [Verrucomicrobiota bacterium]
MSETFLAVNAVSLRAFLDAIPKAARTEGQKLLRGGGAEIVESDPNGKRFRIAIVAPASLSWVLSDDDKLGWTVDCGCPAVPRCAHAFAAAKTLLAEHSHATVQSLSSQTASGDAGTPAGLEGVVSTALGRALAKSERDFIREIVGMYRDSKGGLEVSTMELRRLGFKNSSFFDYKVRLAPFAIKTELEFWQCLAFKASQEKLAMPAFMRGVSDLTEVRRKHERWHAAAKTREWRTKLANLAQPPPIAQALGFTAVCFRIRLVSSGAWLEWRKGNAEDFEPIRRQELDAFIDAFARGAVTMSEASAHIWIPFLHHYQITKNWELLYGNTADLGLLGRLIRNPLLDSLLVNEAGLEIRRSSAPLVWRLVPPAAAEDDYELLLSSSVPGAAPVPPILRVFPGEPALYLTDRGLYEGPARASAELDVSKPNHIPRRALESGEGIAFLRKLGLPIPEHLTAAVQVVPVHIRIHCRLAPLFVGSQSENCLVTMTAHSDDHQVAEVWTGASWSPLVQSDWGPELSDEEDGGIRAYDRSLMDRAPQLMQELLAPFEFNQRAFVLRVKRGFAEMFFEWLESLPREIEVVLEGDLASLKAPTVSAKVRLEVSEVSLDWFDLRVVLDASDTRLTPAEMKLLLNSRGRFVRLEGKGWRRLSIDLSDEDNASLARLGLAEAGFSAEPQRLHVLQLAENSARRFLPETTVQALQVRAHEVKARVTPALPDGLQAALRPYQLEGYHFLAYLSENRFGGILADDMGLGKTLQTLAWLLWLRASANAKSGGVIKPTLVVCPKSVMENWRSEAVKFASGLRVRLWSQSEVERIAAHAGDADIHVINYTHLRTMHTTLTPIEWLAAILDEGQYIKNPDSQTAQAARSLRAEQRLVLTGTPIENRLLDLWSLMAFAMPGLLGSRAQFAKLYDAAGDSLARRRLSARVRPFLLRRTKSQVATDLPSRTEEELLCELEGEQKTLYRAELKRAQQMLLRIKTQKQLAQEHFHFLASLIRLRQICCSPRLVNPKSKEEGAKLEALLDQLEPLMQEGHKVLVFSQFVEMLELIRAEVKRREWHHFILTGATEERGDLVARFQAHEGAAIFLISLKAGGFGLNLTAASYVVLFDPWWNPAVENQAIDRTHRIGQVNNVIAYRLLIKGSVEEKMRVLQKQKSQLAEDVLGEERFAKSLSLEDLQFLFAET